MFSLDTFLLIKCTYFIVWISDGHEASAFAYFHFSLLCFALLTYLLTYTATLSRNRCVFTTDHYPPPLADKGRQTVSYYAPISLSGM